MHYKRVWNGSFPQGFALKVLAASFTSYIHLLLLHWHPYIFGSKLCWICLTSRNQPNSTVNLHKMWSLSEEPQCSLRSTERKQMYPSRDLRISKFHKLMFLLGQNQTFHIDCRIWLPSKGGVWLIWCVLWDSHIELAVYSSDCLILNF